MKLLPLQRTIGDIASIANEKDVHSLFKKNMQLLYKFTQKAYEVEYSKNSMQIDDASNVSPLVFRCWSSSINCLIDCFVKLRNALVHFAFCLGFILFVCWASLWFHRIYFHHRARLLDFAVSLLSGLGDEQKAVLFQALKPALQVWLKVLNLQRKSETPFSNTDVRIIIVIIICRMLKASCKRRHTKYFRSCSGYLFLLDFLINVKVSNNFNI